MEVQTKPRQLDQWETPSDYGGYDPIGHYGVYAKHRDSDTLTRCNWDVACERMAKAAGIEAVPSLADEMPDSSILFGGNPAQAPNVYWWEAGHWAVGWVRYLMVKPDAPDAVLDEAEAIRDDLASYAILDDDRFSEMEMEEADAAWANDSVRGRADYIRRANEHGAKISIFAARHNTPPHDDSGYLDELLRGN